MLVLVTGASAGFGEATCRLLVQKGHKVIGAARRLERLQDLQQELGTMFYPLAMDITEKSSVDAALAALPPPWADIDLLINNAGLALGLEPADKADYAELVGDAQDFLEGRSTAVQKRLGDAMTRAAEAMDFELAAVLRDRLKAPD